MADIILNLFDESKQYVRTIYQRGKDLVGDELNESLDIERLLRRRSLSGIFGSGFIATGFKILPSGNDNEILIEEGSGLIQGEYVNNPSQFPISNLTTPGADRVDIVYLKVREVEITAADDPDIEFADIGETARRIKLEWEVIVDEDSTSLPSTTGDLHDAGIHYELIGYLFRLSGDASITEDMIIDTRRILGFVFLNEDKNLEVVGGGDLTWDSDTGQVSFTEEIRVIQPSTGGHAIIPTSQSPFFLPAAGDTAYIVLNRSATVDYNVSVVLGNYHSIPNNANTFPILYRSTDDKLYAVEGTVWDDGQTHGLRTNPFTGLIVDADVAPGADIDGDKLLDGSVPLAKLETQPESVPVNGVILWFEDDTCPAGYTNLEVGSNDTYLQLMGTGGTPTTTPTGSNTHNHGSHSHTNGSFVITLPLFDITNVGFGGGLNFDAFNAGVGTGVRNQNFSVSGTSGSTTISTVNHEPKHIRGLLCKKDA